MGGCEREVSKLESQLRLVYYKMLLNKIKYHSPSHRVYGMSRLHFKRISWWWKVNPGSNLRWMGKLRLDLILTKNSQEGDSQILLFAQCN